MCLKFQPETILAYAAAEQMSDQDKQYIPQAIELIRNKPLRSFRVDIAADSLVQLDEAQMKQDRMQFLQAFGGFMNQTLPVAQAVPALAPAIVELMKFGIQAFKESRSVEGVLTAAMEQLQENGAPNPQDAMRQQAQAAAQVEQQKAEALMQAEQVKMQASQQVESAKMQLEHAKIAAEQQIEQARLQLEQAKAAAEQQRAQFEAQMAAQQAEQQAEFDRWKAELDAATKIMVAHIASASANNGQPSSQLETVGGDVRAAVENMASVHGQTMEQLTQVMSTLRAPKRIVRGPDGRAVSVESVE
jgi:hypothetical protein